MVVTNLIVGLSKTDKISRDKFCPLVNKLIKCMLSLMYKAVKNLRNLKTGARRF